METKPIVTCHGDQSLFSSLHSAVVQGLPKEPTEWRRSYGRAPKTIQLEASFVPYDEDILPQDTDKTLISRPYFHIFWTDCDMDSYKQTVREEIGEWQNSLRSQNIPDWLIVVVVSDETKVKTKLLPRASVIDKVRNDFCGKQPDRCVVLVEPFKNEVKSLESWNILFRKLRELLLNAFNKHLNKYEENMRSLRENRNEVGWTFTEFFFVQEELAFMFEMLGIYDEALVQYDELDALFDQFVLSNAAGDHITWLSLFCKPCKNWTGVSLAKALDRDKRNLIKDNLATLLDFRDYLFSRQCALLLLMNRPWEVAQRVVDYLHNTVKEVKSLEIDVPDAALSCWIFLSCQEIIQACDRYKDSAQIDAYSLSTANLWDYSRRKLKELGTRCGLMPDPDTEPSSDQLQMVVELLSGLSSQNDDEFEDSNIRPVDKLREALSSRSSFEKHYMELSELAMGTYKHIGRYRFARLIGKDLAEFYVKSNEPVKAEIFLQDAIKMYKDENWQHLVNGTQVQLAEYQKQQNCKEKFVKTACEIASSQLLPITQRKYVHDELLSAAKEIEDKQVLIPCSHVFHFKEIGLLSSEVILNEDQEIKVWIKSLLPGDITCDSISITLREVNTQGNSDNRLSVAQTNVILNDFCEDTSFQSDRAVTLPIFGEFQDERLGRIVNCGLTCENTKQLLCRMDSGASLGKRKAVHLIKDFGECANAESVSLKPGVNEVNLKHKVSELGDYRLGQLCVKYKALEFLQSLSHLNLCYKVICEEPGFTILPCKTDEFLAGISQKFSLTLITGSFSCSEKSQLHLTATNDLSVGHNGASHIDVPPFQPKQEKVFDLFLFQESKPTDLEETESKITARVDCLNRTLTKSLSFLHPFRVSHGLHTSKERKFIQYILHGNSNTIFSISDQKLEALNSKDVEFIPLNKPGKTLTMNKIKSVSYMWQLRSNIPEPPPLDLEFSFKYQCDIDEEKKTRNYSYKCHIENYKTLYTLACDVICATDEDKTFRVGALADLKITVNRVNFEKIAPERLVYEVSTNSKYWAFCGKTTGVFTMNEKNYSTRLDVIPLVAGFLPLPTVHLHRYDPSASTEHEDTLKQKEDQLYDSMDHSSGSSSREATLIRFIPFSRGQVYCSSTAKQVRVQPEIVTGDIDVTIM